MPTNIILWIVLAAAAIIVIWLVIIFNSLIKLKNQTEEAISDIDVQLKRRYDLIPNLINTVKGYAKHEQETLEKVVKARNKAMEQNPENVKEKAQAENALSGTLKSLFALAENYPDLKANQNFLKLQDELTDTENKIQAARRFYNNNVRDFNIKTQTIPNNLVAGILGFNQFDYFEADEGERENIEVKF